MRSDKAWESIGRTEPYFGVISQARFLGDGCREDFFRSGEEHAAFILARARELVPDFAPRRAVDFGCGVGRVLIPLARTCETVIGIDVSSGMLSEARRNCESRGVTNVEFLGSPDDLRGHFDLIHSYTVFQHIPVKQGLQRMQTLLEHLADGGIGALHFVYANRRPTWRRIVQRVYRMVPGALKLANILRGRPAGFPLMQMNPYPLDLIFDALQRQHCERFGGYFTDHGGHLGMMLLFQRARRDSH